MVQLDLTKQKTDVVLINNRRKRNTISIQVGRHISILKPLIKYLGVMIGTKINVESHLDYAYEKAAKASVSLVRMLPNVGDPSYSRRGVTEPIY